MNCSAKATSSCHPAHAFSTTAGSATRPVEVGVGGRRRPGSASVRRARRTGGGTSRVPPLSCAGPGRARTSSMVPRHGGPVARRPARRNSAQPVPPPAQPPPAKPGHETWPSVTRGPGPTPALASPPGQARHAAAAAAVHQITTRARGCPAPCHVRRSRMTAPVKLARHAAGTRPDPCHQGLCGQALELPGRPKIEPLAASQRTGAEPSPGSYRLSGPHRTRAPIDRRVCAAKERR